MMLAALLSGLLLLSLFGSLAMREWNRSHDRPRLRVQLFPLPQAEPPPRAIEKPVAPSQRPASAARTAPPPERVEAGPVPLPPANNPPQLVTGSKGDTGIAQGPNAEGRGTGRGDRNGTDGAGRSPRATEAETEEYLPPQWAVVPGDRELGPHDPWLAKQGRVSGSVVLACHVLATEQLSDCLVIREKPGGYGFAQAGLAAARSFRVKPPRRNGAIAEHVRVLIPISFVNP